MTESTTSTGPLVAAESPNGEPGALTSDPVLLDRLAAACAAGFIPPAVDDLARVPGYRRDALLDDRLTEWETARVGGPCAACGSALPRRGRGPFRLADRASGEVEGPRFTTYADRPMCEWCRDYVREHGEQRLREAVYSAVSGLRGVRWVRSHTDPAARATPEVVPFRWEHPDPGPAGVPWLHLDRARIVADAAARAVAEDYARLPAEVVTVPGIDPAVPGVPEGVRRAPVGQVWTPTTARAEVERAEVEGRDPDPGAVAVLDAAEETARLRAHDAHERALDHRERVHKAGVRVEENRKAAEAAVKRGGARFLNPGKGGGKRS